MAEDAATDALFERLRQLQSRAPDSVEVARTLSARINNRVSSPDKWIKQTALEKLWDKNTGALQVLLTLLESGKDCQTSVHIASILRETVCLKQGKGKKATANNVARQECSLYLLSLNATQIVLRAVLQQHSRRDAASTSLDATLVDLIWVLASLAQKDPKFPVKLRLMGGVRTMHSILKIHYSDSKLIFPLLVLMKQLSKNTFSTAVLLRDGVTTTYERILVTLGFIPTARLRLCLDAIDYFSKNKICCMQIVKSGLSNILLRVFDRWDRYEGRMRLKICAHILQTLQHVCQIKAGRRALCTKKHVQILHRFCVNCPDDPDFDGLLARVCTVITSCLKHQALPVSATSPATFNLGHIIKDDVNTGWPFKDEFDDERNSDTRTFCSDFEDDLSDADLEVYDEVSDFDKGLFGFKSSSKDAASLYLKNAENISTYSSSFLFTQPERDLEDLKKYSVFFKEFGGLNKQIKMAKSRSNSKGSIATEECVACQKPSITSATLHNISESSFRSNISTNTFDPKSLQLQRILEPSGSVSCSCLRIHKDIPRYNSFASTYTIIASRTRSIIRFVKVAYPDMMGGKSLCVPEPLNVMERTACREKLLACVERAINPEAYLNEVVYDLDVLCAGDNSQTNTKEYFLTNTDEYDIMKNNSFSNKLAFESRFESGNLRKAIQIGPREYELILMPDVNSSKRHQWFYFEVRNMQAGKPYVFNIVNCEKSDSQFNFGMKPVLFSVREATLGRLGWVRSGTDICYYRNSYHYSHQKVQNKCYLTVTFTITFPHSGDVCYLAYHFPFTYSMMLTRIWQWSLSLPPSTYLRVEPLCYSLNNNEVPLLTITADETSTTHIGDRDIVFLTARVHPGESNASWVMDGTLRCLLEDSPTAAALRRKYVFKIVPMLNVEGVINGCYRCGLTNEDLNRRWSKPSSSLHPSIYHAKGLIEYLSRVWKKPPVVYCDYHGHSRKKNVFFYGCSGVESWCPNDKLVPDQPVKYLMLPALMHRVSPAFALASCSFRVEREREGTARVTVWRHLGVLRSYTMEASFCGFDKGPFKGYHLNTQHLQNIGTDFCEALNGLNEDDTVDLKFTKDLNGVAVDSEEGSGSDSILKTDSDEEYD